MKRIVRTSIKILVPIIIILLSLYSYSLNFEKRVLLDELRSIDKSYDKLIEETNEKLEAYQDTIIMMRNECE